LLVIPLHRDHGIISMAAGKNDVIKLLPPLTLSEAEARTFLDAFEAVLADVHGPASKNWSVVRDIAVSTLRRRAAAPTAGAQAARRGKPIDPEGGDVCLVTGASGFIGGHIAARLVKDGYQVRCLVRASSDTAALERLGVELVVSDLTDAPSLLSAAEGCRFVVHCGAKVTDWGSAQELVRVNVHGTRHVLEAAARADVDRFVHVSTTDVYGYPDAAAVTEDYRGRGFKNWYAETKRAAEEEVRRFERERGLPVVILRPATVYGPGSYDLVQNIANAIRGGYMLHVRGGNAVAGLAYVDNVVDVALLALRHEGAPGHAFNVSDGLSVTWRQFTDALARGIDRRPVRLSAPYWLASALGFALEVTYRLVQRITRLHTDALLTRQAVHVLGTHQDFSNERARTLLGWSPRVDFDDGLAATLAWLAAQRRR
jgi:nucleoside-diphosphate-sugar epimerase